MTALNLFCQGQNAFMLTDAAATDLDGVLLSTRPKALTLRRARMAICWTGFAPMTAGGARFAPNAAGARMKAALFAHGVDAERAMQGEIMAAMPAALRTMHIENLTSMPGATAEMMSISVGVALWCETEGAKVVMGQTEEAHGLPAYSFARLRHYISTEQGYNAPSFISKAIGRVANLADPLDFDVRRDGVALLEAQRRIRKSYSGSTHHGVGGKAVMIKVSKSGVCESVLRRWPDKVGRQIMPSPA